MFGHVSGAHFNPAVTLAVFIKEGTDKMKSNLIFMLLIWTFQVLGMVLGALLAAITLPNYTDIAWLCPPVANSL